MTAESATDGTSDEDIERRVDEQLEALGLPYELFCCDPSLADTAAFCDAYGFELADSANTILVVGKTEPAAYAACVLLATTRLDVNHAVRRRLGARKASFADQDLTRRHTGMAIGGVTPLALGGDLPIWIDERVMSRRRIVLGGGSRKRKILAPPNLLTALPRAEVVRDLAFDVARHDNDHGRRDV